MIISISQVTSVIIFLVKSFFFSFLARKKPDCCQVSKGLCGPLGSGVESTKERYSQDNLAFLVSLNAKHSRNKTSPLKPKKKKKEKVLRMSTLFLVSQAENFL